MAPRFYFPYDSMQFAIACFGKEFDPLPQCSLSWWARYPRLTQTVTDSVIGRHKCGPAKWLPNPSNGLNNVRERDGWQTDHAMEKCIVIIAIA